MLREPICSEKCETLAAGNGNESLPKTVITGSEEGSGNSSKSKRCLKFRL